MTNQMFRAIHARGRETAGVEVPMIPLLKRHEIQVLLAAGHGPKEVAKLSGVSLRTVHRIKDEEGVERVDDVQERQVRGVGRPRVAESFRNFVVELLESEPELMSKEILRRAKAKGYSGKKTAMYELVASLRPKGVAYQMRFEGLPGEFSQHDFGQVDVRFGDGTKRRVHFFASRLKYSRFAQVTLVPNQQVETLVRTLADHFEAFEGMPLLAVFDRPKTVALSWKKNGEVTEWNPVFAYASLELGFSVEVCWPYQARQKGSVEALVKWVKNSFFKQRVFHDMEDLEQQLGEWLHEVNYETPSRATGEIPAERLTEDRARLRPLRVQPQELALRIPVSVGPTAEVVHDTHRYTMPPDAAGLPGTLYLYRDRVRIVAGRHEAVHERLFEAKAASVLPEHRAAQLAALSGKRGKRYLKRQHILETGEAALVFLTELTHRRRNGSWTKDIEQLHELLQVHGPDALNLALRAAVDARNYTVAAVARYLGRHSVPGQLPLLQQEVSP